MSTRQRGSSIQRVTLKSGEFRWRFRVDVPAADGSRKQRTLTFATEREAVAEQAKLRTAVAAGSYTAPDKITVSEWLDAWIYTNERSWRASTTASYRVQLKPAREAFGSTRLQRLTRADVERLVRSMLATGGRTGTGRSPRTVALLLTILVKSLNDAVHDGLVPVNVAARVRKPAQTHREAASWSAADLSAFLAFVADEPLVGAWALSCLGLRRGEVLGLKWGDVDFAKGVIHVRRARVQAGSAVVENEPKTARGRRTIPMHAGLVAALKTTRARTNAQSAILPLKRDADRFVVVNSIGEPLLPDYYSDLFERLSAAAGLPRIPLHGLRHSALSVLVDAGAPITVVAKIAGHDPSVTMRTYAHADEAAMVAAVDRLGALFQTS